MRSMQQRQAVDLHLPARTFETTGELGGLLRKLGLLRSNLFRHKILSVYYFTSPIDDLEQEPDGVDPEDESASHATFPSIDAPSDSNESKVSIGAPSALDASMAKTSSATDYDVDDTTISQEEMRNMKIFTAWAQSGDSGVLDYLKPPW
jgi:hypothetical protein